MLGEDSSGLDRRKGGTALRDGLPEPCVTRLLDVSWEVAQKEGGRWAVVQEDQSAEGRAYCSQATHTSWCPRPDGPWRGLEHGRGPPGNRSRE